MTGDYMASKYDDYWLNLLDVIADLIGEAHKRGVSRSIDVSDLKKYGERKNWYGDVIVSEKGISKGKMAHARSLGRVVLENRVINSGKFRFVITYNLRLRVEKLKVLKKLRIDTRYSAKSSFSSSFPMVSKIFSLIPVEVWNKIVREEPEWTHMFEFLEKYGFGKFATMIVVVGLNDFQLKGRSELAYWPNIKEILKSNKIPESPRELESILTEFYSNERFPDLKLRRLNRFLSSRLAESLWNARPKDMAENFLRIWHELANTMGQDRSKKTIVFAMKCLGVALLMAGESNFNFEKIPIPVDSRVKKFTERLGVVVGSDEDVRRFWSKVLEELRKMMDINMIHLDSLIWQIGVLSKGEIIDYFAKLNLKMVGEKIVGGF